MKLPVIKALAENQTLENLRKAEEELLNGEALSIEVEGVDEGEQLTHILGAIDILERVEKEGVDLRTSTRTFFERVRNSIS
jgi:hypothetical protein